MAPSEVHLNPETLESYFSAGVPAVIPISPRLGAELHIDPHYERLQLTLPGAGAEPEVLRYERIDVERRNSRGGGEEFLLTLDASEIHYEAYSFLESILDYMRGGSSFRKAVSDALMGQAELLAKRTKLSEPQIIGLWGELDVVAHLLAIADEDQVLRSWLGPLAQEHDFSFQDFEAEVKTTTGNTRRHLINSATQLQPAPNRPLYLISLQITLAGDGVVGSTLPQKIEEVRDRMKKTRRLFDQHLTSLGYHDEDSSLYPNRYQLRSQPRMYEVDARFPAITQPRLDGAVPQSSLVSEVSYRVDVTALPFTRPPRLLNHYAESPSPQ